MIKESNFSNPAQKVSPKTDRNALILLILLIGSWAFFLWDKNKSQDIIHSKEDQITSTSGERNALQHELDAASIRYDELKKTDLAKDSALEMRDKDIAAKKLRIRELLKKNNTTQAEFVEAKAMIASLNDDIELYKQQIAILQQEKAALTTANEVLKTEKGEIQQQFDKAKQDISEKENTIDIGSTLHASNFNVMALNVKKNGNMKMTDKASKADKLRIRFDLDPNRITKTGSKTLFIIITDPNGKVLTANEADASFDTKENGRITYSQKMDVNYEQNTRQTVEFDWTGVREFQPGNYKIEVYNNGFKIGGGACPLRKPGILG
jgi:hypothetical protein